MCNTIVFCIDQCYRNIVTTFFKHIYYILNGGTMSICKHTRNIFGKEKRKAEPSKEGKLDRRKLGEEVFSKKDRLAQLNEIVFRFLVPEVERSVTKLPDGLYAIDAINLLESGLDRLCDRTIAITAPVELRVRRIMARDGISEQYARLRISAQKPDEYYRSKCDCELNNALDTPAEFEKLAVLFFQKLMETVREEKRHGA